MTTKVFISYRREDVDTEAGRICAALRDVLGNDAVFQDVSAMSPGDDFPQRIVEALNASQVVLALIGPKWLTASDKYGRRRIDSVEDWVHKELSIALANQDTSLIPVPLSNAEMPPAEALPEGIAELANRLSAIPVRTDFWDHDIRPLVASVAALCGVDPTTVPRPAASPVPSGYLDWVKHEYGTVELLGLETAAISSGGLRQVYVPAVTDRPNALADSEQSARKGARLSAKPHAREDEQDRPQLLLDLLGTSSAYVPGAPGAGKSTFCRWLAWVIANGAVPSHSLPPPEGYCESIPAELAGKLPLLVKLRDFSPHMLCRPGVQTWRHKQLEAALAAWLDEAPLGGLTGATFRQQLAAGQVVLALDGVDEVATAQHTNGGTTHPRACLLSGLADALGAWHEAGNRVIVTSRPYGLKDAEIRKLNLPVQSLGPLPAPLQALFIERWYAATDAGRREENTRGLKEHLASRADLNELTQSPLLLTALCIRFGQGQRLPDDLFDLYDGLVSSVLYSRYGADSAKRDLVRYRLAAIAYGMHTGPQSRPRAAPAAQVRNEEADEHLRQFAAVNRSTEGKLHEPAKRRNHLLEKSGLLQAADSDHVQFYHLSFQEFLSADHVIGTQRADEQLLAVMRERGGERAWRPTLMYLFTGLVKRNRQWSLELLSQLADDLTRERVAENPSLAAFAAQGAEVLLKKGMSLGPLSDRLKQVSLNAIADEVEVQDRYVLGLALGALGDPRVTKARDPGGFVEIPAGEYRDSQGEVTVIKKSFLLGRYPVTNSQYRAFMAVGGYENMSFWPEAGVAWLAEAKVKAPRYWNNTRYNYANQPVVGVSYWEAQAYCAWVGGQLPSEEQWAAAAGGPTGHEYPWGEKWEDGICNTFESGLRKLSSVGCFPRSAQADFGLHDVAGNVFEWCGTMYKDSPRGGADNAGRVVRGGSWGYGSQSARSAIRLRFGPGDRFNDLGFRVLCSSPILDSDH